MTAERGRAAGAPLRAALAGLALGALAAAGIACGAARSTAKSSAPAEPAAPTAAEGAPPAGPVDARLEIDRYTAAIDADLAQLGLARPPLPAGACVQPPCDAARLSVEARPTAGDPSCKAPVSETCVDACRLSGSICDNAGRICRIAADLGGADAYANEKCSGGKASCEAARARCCGCEI